MIGIAVWAWYSHGIRMVFAWYIRMEHGVVIALVRSLVSHMRETRQDKTWNMDCGLQNPFKVP